MSNNNNAIRFNPWQDSFLSLDASLLTALSSYTHDERIKQSLRDPCLLSEGFHALPTQVAKDRHQSDDKFLFQKLVGLLDKDSIPLAHPYATNIRRRISVAESVANATPIDPNIPDWWPSLGRAFYDYLKDEFAAHGAEDLRELKKALYAHGLQDHAGDVMKLKAAVLADLRKFVSALAAAGRDTAQVESEFCDHIVDHVDDYDSGSYAATCANLRMRPHLNLTSVFSALSKQHRARTRGQRPAKPTSVLQTDAPRPGNLGDLSSMIRDAVALQLDARGDKRKRHARPPLSEADIQLKQLCVAKGVCFNLKAAATARRASSAPTASTGAFRPPLQTWSTCPRLCPTTSTCKRRATPCPSTWPPRLRGW